MSHFVNVCKHGYVYGQCRCPSRDKQQRLVPCSNDQRHRERALVEYRPKHSSPDTENSEHTS